MVKRNFDLLDTAGCILYMLLSFLVGPIVCVWLCMRWFQWPTWLDYSVGITVGGVVGYHVMLLIMLPFAFSADRKASKRS